MSVRLARLGDICFMRTGKLNSNAAVEGGEYPFFTCAQETYKINEYAFETEAVLLGGNNANGVFPLKYYRGRFNAYQRTYVIEPRSPDNLKTRYLYYALRPALAYFESVSIGAATQYLTKGILDSFKIQIYDVETQARIADILSAYDDLIETNQRRIALLERAARELHREWFVRLRFPGHEHTKIVDGVPEGWSTKALGEIADIVMGQSPKSVYYNEEGTGLPFHQGVTNFGSRFPSHRVYCTMENRTANPGDILFSVRAPVGRINITLDRVLIGRGIAAIRSNRNQQRLLFYALKSHFFREDMLGVGAIFAAIKKEDLYGTRLTLASDQIAKAFRDHIEPVDSQIEALHLMIESLTQARDLLLPRLMSGEVAA